MVVAWTRRVAAQIVSQSPSPLESIFRLCLSPESSHHPTPPHASGSVWASGADNCWVLSLVFLHPIFPWLSSIALIPKLLLGLSVAHPLSMCQFRKESPPKFKKKKREKSSIILRHLLWIYFFILIARLWDEYQNAHFFSSWNKIK